MFTNKPIELRPQTFIAALIVMMFLLFWLNSQALAQSGEQEIKVRYDFEPADNLTLNPPLRGVVGSVTYGQCENKLSCSLAIAENPCQKWAVIDADNLNIRDKPNGKKLGQYPRRTMVCQREKQQEWIKTDHGWVSAKFVKDSIYNQNSMACTVACTCAGQQLEFEFANLQTEELTKNVFHLCTQYSQSSQKTE